MPLVTIYYDTGILGGKRPEELLPPVLTSAREQIRDIWCTDGVDLDIEEVEMHVHQMSEFDVSGPGKFKMLITSNAMPERLKRKKETSEQLAGALQEMLKDCGVECRVVVSVSFSDSWSHLT